MEFKKFFTGNTFELLMVGTSNWDYYRMLPGEAVVSIAKPGSGAQDSFFGDMKYFEKMRKEKAI